MSFKVEVTSRFNKQAKQLFKKYPSIKTDISKLIDSLYDNPKQGISLGQSCFKVRLAITSKGKGKSSGARVITYVLIEKNTVYLVSIYDKSEQSTISDQEITSLISNI